jgi:hypothetical protein
MASRNTRCSASRTTQSSSSYKYCTNRGVVNVFRSQPSELQWPVSHWPRLLAPLRHYLNNKPRQLLKNKAPIELALGIPRQDPLRLGSADVDQVRG